MMWTAVITVASLTLVAACFAVLFAYPYWFDDE